jgi:hypothetical protein
MINTHPPVPQTEAEWVAHFRAVADAWREQDPELAAMCDAAAAHLQSH